MKAKLKSLLGILVAVSMMLSIVPTFASAAQYGDGIMLNATPTTGTVTYDDTSRTLTLNGCTLSSSAKNNSVIYYPGKKDLTINLIGDNKITAPQALSASGNLTIKGTGTLTIIAEKLGVYAMKKLTIGAVKVSSKTNQTNSCAIQSKQDSVFIINSANVKAESNNAPAISSSKDINITDSNVISDVQGNAEFPQSALNTGYSGAANITNSTVTAKSTCGAGVMAGDVNFKNSTIELKSIGSQYNCGLQAENNVVIDGGSIDIATSSPDSIGLWAVNTLTIKNKADVTVKTTIDGTYTCVQADTGMSISDSTLTAEAKAGCAIWTSGALEIKDNSNINAKSEAAGGYPAINSANGITISDSTVSAEAASSCGIYSQKAIPITNSVIDSKGSQDSDGIYSKENVTANGSWITTSGKEKLTAVTNSVLINGKEGKVHGNATIPKDVTIPADTKIVVPKDATLNVPQDKSFTNNGTIEVEGTFENKGTVVCTNHSGGTATCLKKAVCSVCGKEYGELAAHTLTHVEAVKATCKSEGNIEYWKCSVCNKMFTDKDAKNEVEIVKTEIDPNNHDLVSHEGKAPTQTEKGYKPYQTCTRCDYTTYEEIPMLPTYEVISGANSEIQKNSDDTLTFKFNGEFAKFTGLKIDGKEVDRNLYTAVEGSTVITLKKELLQSLSASEHSLTAVYTDGECTTSFTISAESESPHTGESYPLIPVGAFSLMCLSLAYLIYYYRKKESAK